VRREGNSIVIHETAIIDDTARLADGVIVGAYSIIGADVEIGEGTSIGPHVVIKGATRIGKENKIYQFSSLGEDPQDKKYAGEKTWLEIGDRNVIRESVTLNRGTGEGGGVTKIGDDNWIMAYSHVAHDCRIGNNTIFANAASLAGHVTVDDHAILGGFTNVHQFCNIGAHSFTAVSSIIVKDVPPYVMASGHYAEPHGLNSRGLKARGFSAESIQIIKRAYKILYKSGLKFAEAKQEINNMAKEYPELKIMSEFLEKTERGVIR
jgi:UDP-N-acetylglucosamine acyltransferase